MYVYVYLQDRPKEVILSCLSFVPRRTLVVTGNPPVMSCRQKHGVCRIKDNLYKSREDDEG